MLAIFEYGRLLMVRHLVVNAAREGARQAVISPASTATAVVENTVADSMAGQPLEGLQVRAYRVDPASGAELGSWQSTPFGCPLAVEITGIYQPMVPTLGVLPRTLPVHVVCIMNSEAN
jgi:hypothetical protein